MSSDTAWSIPCCAAVSVSISVEGPLLAVGAPLCELGDDGTEGEAEESGAACVKVGHTVKVKWSSVWFTCMHCQCRTGPPLVSHLARFLKVAAAIWKTAWKTEPTFLAQ